MNMKYPCKDCTDRYYACWDTCDRYKTVRDSKKLRDEADMYIASKSKYYRTEYGWRKMK